MQIRTSSWFPSNIRHAYMPLLQNLWVAITVGLSLGLFNLCADHNGWSYGDMSLVFGLGGIVSIATYFLMHHTAAYTVEKWFNLAFGAFMGACMVAGLASGASFAFWCVLAVIKGILFPHFYHGTRLKFLNHAKPSDFSKLFSLHYIILCVGCILGAGALSLWPTLWAGLLACIFSYLLLAFCGLYEPVFKPRNKKDLCHKPLVANLAYFPYIALLGLCAGVMGESLYSFIIKISFEQNITEFYALNSFNILLVGAVVLQYPLAVLLDKAMSRTFYVSSLLAIVLTALFTWQLDLSGWAAHLFLVGGIFGLLALAGESIVQIVPAAAQASVLQLVAFTYTLGDSLAEPALGTMMEWFDTYGLIAFYLMVIGVALVAFSGAMRRARLRAFPGMQPA